MSAEIEALTGAAPVLEAGFGGVFDVFFAGKRIFSKSDEHRFPEIGEIGLPVRLVFDSGT